MLASLHLACSGMPNAASVSLELSHQCHKLHFVRFTSTHTSQALACFFGRVVGPLWSQQTHDSATDDQPHPLAHTLKVKRASHSLNCHRQVLGAEGGEEVVRHVLWLQVIHLQFAHSKQLLPHAAGSASHPS